jgi:hypothetical protein
MTSSERHDSDSKSVARAAAAIEGAWFIGAVIVRGAVWAIPLRLDAS